MATPLTVPLESAARLYRNLRPRFALPQLVTTDLDLVRAPRIVNLVVRNAVAMKTITVTATTEMIDEIRGASVLTTMTVALTDRDRIRPRTEIMINQLRPARDFATMIEVRPDDQEKRGYGP